MLNNNDNVHNAMFDNDNIYIFPLAVLHAAIDDIVELNSWWLLTWVPVAILSTKGHEKILITMMDTVKKKKKRNIRTDKV